MMDEPSAANLVAYSVQIACVVVAGALLPSLLRLDAPVVRYQFWRGLGLLCLALPWVQPRMVKAVATGGVTSTTGFAADATGVPNQAAAWAAFADSMTWWAAAAGVLAIGMAARLMWLMVGVARLRRLRQAGEAAAPCEEHDELQRLLGTRAEIRFVAGLAQPVTFGLLEPVVLLPSTLRDRAEDVRRAVVAHELIHVQRRDWAWVLLEECVRAAFWFHPAVWWLISRVQLAREEVVDELTVLVTGRRRTYVEALLAFADETPLAPAAAFARRRHLFRRMMLISKEAPMSSQRVVASCAVMALVVACGSWYAVGAFPLVNARQQPTQQTLERALSKTPGPLEQQAVPITPENPIPRRVNATPAEYPVEARAQNASGVITLQVTVDSIGRVAEARVLNMRVRWASGEMSFTQVSPQELDGMLRGTARDQELAEVRAILVAFIHSAVTAVQQSRYDAPYQAPISFPITFNFAPEGGTAGTAMPPPPPPPPPPGVQSTGWTTDGALRVGGAVKPPTKIRDVRPEYPPDARQNRVQGIVIVEARIEPDGSVGDARVLRSIPLLDQAALDAVKQWKFTPTLMNGQAVPVIMTVTVNFTLQ
jgi:protein TonB